MQLTCNLEGGLAYISIVMLMTHSSTFCLLIMQGEIMPLLAKSQMAEKFLQLNQDKTEVLLVGPKAQRQKLNSGDTGDV